MDPNQLNERVVGGDLLVGADAIRAFLVYLGMPEGTDPYYLRRAKRWPIGNTGGGGGGKLIASKRRLIRHAEELTRGDDERQRPKRRARSDQYELPAE
jgi:hypothetical protein